ncbi:alpha/beta hydrolase [Chondromyces crocatus]|uniref:AB hydrolase-1 domain-containing protein n=1 Tax=Chondromyces crocatus TaxID=52 RepID=A0A0K1ER73_CHOCO|nr:alpha/beta hydrolase [Chondromyces crocatus]AKT43324.1 uncharacterized protein CMC5_075560 [Chondromyces crocatus]
MNKVARFARGSGLRAISGLLTGAVMMAVSALSGQAEAAQDHAMAAQGGSAGRTCTRLQVPVALTQGATQDHEIAADLCVPSGAVRETALVTIHGVTYSTLYWDFPYEPERYSFVRRANEAGYATLNFDRISSRDSSRPVSLQVTLTSQAYIHHQLVSALRSGEFGPAFSKVVLVGHSLGSVLSLAQSAWYGDVDGLALTGFLHMVGAGFPIGLLNLVPAVTEPRFASLGLDLGYVTTRAGARGSTFYHLPNADPAVIAVDEQNKEVLSLTELAEFPVVASPLVSLQVKVPVLNVIGRHDALFCGLTPCGTPLSGTSTEPLAYGPAAELEQVVIPSAGHDLNLQRNAPVTYAAILSWLERRFP